MPPVTPTAWVSLMTLFVATATRAAQAFSEIENWVIQCATAIASRGAPLGTTANGGMLFGCVISAHPDPRCCSLRPNLGKDSGNTATNNLTHPQVTLGRRRFECHPLFASDFEI